MAHWVDPYLDVAREVAHRARSVAPRLRSRPNDVAVAVHDYAWASFEAFTRRYYADPKRRVVALSMNPGPNGAVQTGIPFCDVATARRLLPDFDDLVPQRPARVRSDRPEMSARRLQQWAAQALGGLEALYARVLFPVAFPVGILRGGANLALPALRGAARRTADRLYEWAAPRLVESVPCRGIMLLGSYAAERWAAVVGHEPRLGRVRAISTHHPAAHMSNADKFSGWSRAVGLL